ncbi:PREDICTED: protein MIZU-KUSSEI 1 [Ipomoea nil]|uniref:protein MIZU-KUSSEI 1 n=1 Tax=Ipomoea nil TaxID=35883 RepID=UPI0009013DF7|nr:PREDICTED: protein MIZU-KUSSEI 1 [Ipomoea nil]
MAKINALRRLFLPCFTPATANHSLPITAAATKKRLSTSLRDDLDDPKARERGSNNNNNNVGEEYSDPDSPTCTAASVSSHSAAQPRSSKTMVVGTIFGHRRGGHVWFCVQHDRLNAKPYLLLELSITATTLTQEMGGGLVRIALEVKDDGASESELSHCPLHAIPLWTLFCNGRKLGFAVRRKPTQQTRLMLKTMQSISVGAGVIPSGFGAGVIPSGFGAGDDPEELMYMRANYECIIGGADSESFHLINPDEGPGQEFSIYLLRSR